MIKCVECDEPIRRLDPDKDKGIDPRDFDWTHVEGGPYCDWSPVATPPRDTAGVETSSS